MKCPRDGSVLSLQESELVVGQVCTKCAGVFLEEKGVSVFRYNHETSVLEKIFQLPSQIDSSISCPSCNAYMMIAYVDDVEIDLCEKCRGIWFDKREMSKIIKKYSSNSDGKGNVAYSILEMLLCIF